MTVSVAKVGPPYDSRFYFTTDTRDYPATSGLVLEDERRRRLPCLRCPEHTLSNGARGRRCHFSGID